MKTTDKMLEATKELWKSYNEHPFVKGIQDLNIILCKIIFI